MKAQGARRRTPKVTRTDSPTAAKVGASREVTALRQFARDVLNGYTDENVGDIDGLWLEGRAYGLGLLVCSGPGYALAPSLRRLRYKGDK